MYDLSGRVAIITGGASGMGRAASLLFAQAGANVVVADLNDTEGEEVAKLASESGNGAVFQHTDVSVESDIEALVARATDTFGRLDIMFNNAGIGGAVGPLVCCIHSTPSSETVGESWSSQISCPLPVRSRARSAAITALASR